MRRGLMQHDEAEIPAAVLHARVARLQSEMARAGLDAMLLYADLSRSAAVSHLIGFSPYWADGALLVPRAGTPVFATTLSNRVATWVRGITPVPELAHNPRPGLELAGRLEGVRRLGVLELELLPIGLRDDLQQNRPGVEWVEARPVFAAARATDPTERALLARADALARAALDAVDPAQVPTANDVVACAEEEARAGGAEEAYVAIAPDLAADARFLRLNGPRARGPSFAVRMGVAYKGAWVRRTRTYGPAPAVGQANEWLEALLPRLHPASLAGQLAEAASRLPTARLVSWHAETALGTWPLAVVATQQDGTPPAAQALSVTLRLDLAGTPWLGGGLAGE